MTADAYEGQQSCAPEGANDSDLLTVRAAKRLETALASLKLLLNFHQIPAETEQLRHALGGVDEPSGIDLVRLARAMGAKARLLSVTPDRLERQPLPALAELDDGRFVILARCSDGKVLVHSADGEGSGTFSIDEFAVQWLGENAPPGAKGELTLRDCQSKCTPVFLFGSAANSAR